MDTYGSGVGDCDRFDCLFNIFRYYSCTLISRRDFPIKSAEVLVVEGWLPDYAIQQALTEFKNGSYNLVITTGGSIEKGNYLSEYKSFAEVSAATFEKLGLESEKVVAVPTPNVIKDRSYASAAEFDRWLSHSNLKLKSINVFFGCSHP